MVKNDLIDRYIYAVTKHMKSAMKKDVAAELETIIQDMLEERCEDVTPTERDIKVVLTELGTPNELASKYKGETQDCLIGQPYYSLYVYVLKIVTVCISGGMLLAQIMAALTSHTIWYTAIYRTIGGIFGGILTGFAFVTLLFAFFYKKGIKVTNPFFFILAFDAPHEPYNIDQTAWYEGQETWEPNTKRYASLITHMDAAIGRLLNELEQLNLRKNTLIIFASDNGAAIQAPIKY